MSPIQDPAVVKPMQRDDMLHGLATLDEAIGNSELLMSVAPLRLISVGGSLAVCFLRNRSASFDIDCVLEPNIAQEPDYASDFTRAVKTAAINADLQDEWLNRDLEIFIARSRRMDLFLASVDQDIRLYEGPNLVVYAGRLEWALERKIRRIGHATDRRDGKDVDLPDAVALVHQMVRDSGKPLTYTYVAGLNWNGFDAPPTKATLDTVARAYADTYGEQGLVDID